MNINQYMCNMKVLAGLVIANDTILEIDKKYSLIKVYGIHLDEFNKPRIEMVLKIYTEKYPIDVRIWESRYPFDQIYVQNKAYQEYSGTYLELEFVELKVFFR